MVPARKLLRGRCDGYGGGCYDVDIRRKGFCPGGFSVSSGPELMAEDGSRSGGSEDEEAGGGGEGRRDERGEVGTSSKGEEREEGWLRLSIGEGGGGGGAVDGYSSPGGTKLDAVPVVDTGRTRRVGELLELDLFREKPPDSRPVLRPPLPCMFPPAAGLPTTVDAMVPLLPPHPGSPLLGYRPYVSDMTWGFWSPQASTSSALPGPYNSRLFVYQMPGSSASPTEGESSAAAGDLRVVSPPSRPHAGVWFVLQASQNQVREPFLPQIPKSYLRIKDGRMTVRLLMKYLVNKLGLDNESEVEITCRGEQLHPFLTLQHVRDSIWCSRDVVPLLPDSPSNHVMILHYGRIA